MAGGITRHLRRAWRILGWSITGLLLLVVVCALLLLVPAVQQVVAQRLAAIATERLGAEVRIGHFAVRPFLDVELGQVYIGDLRGDTLIALEELRVSGLRIHPRRELVQAASLRLSGARFKLHNAADDPHSNLTNLLGKLASGDTTTSAADWKVRCTAFHIADLRFTYHHDEKERKRSGVDFAHVDVQDADLRGHHLWVAGDSVLAHLDGITLREHGGLALERLSGAAQVSPRGIIIEAMRLRTDRSELNGELRFITEDWSDYDEFTQLVTMRLELDSSRLDFADVALFAPELEGIQLPIGLHGRVRGTVADLKGRGLRIDFGERSHFAGNAELMGLPDLSNTFMLLDIEELRTDHRDVAALPVPPFTSGARLEAPRELKELGTLQFTGNFTGFLHAFTAYGTSRTALGELRTDLSYKRHPGDPVFDLRGRLATSGFRLGPLIGLPALGNMAANIRLTGHGRSLAGLHADLDGEIPMIEISGTRLQGIVAKGRLEPKLFNGSLRARDENLVLNFDGLADLRGQWPQVDFKADLQHADLGALGITRVKDYNTLSVLVEAEGRLSPDSLLGRVELKGISYCDEEGEHDLGDLLLTSGRRDGENVVDLVSTFADAEVRGTFLPTKLPGAITSVVYSVFPSLRDEVVYAQAEQRFRFMVRTKDTGPVLGLFVPGLSVDSGGTIEGWLDSRSFDIGLTARLPEVRRGDLRASGIQVIADKTLDVLAFSIASERQSWRDSLWISGTSLTGKAYQDEVDLALGWRDSQIGTNGHVDVLGEVRGLDRFTLDLMPSRIFLGRGDWETLEAATVRIDKDTIRIEPLALHNAGQRITIAGTISPDTTAALDIGLVAVRLENLKPFLGGPVLRGSVGGEAQVHGLRGSPYVLAHLDLDSVRVRDIPVGDITFDARWAEGQRAIALLGTLHRGPIKALDFDGAFRLGADEELDLRLVMDRFDLTFIDPYLPEGISGIQGLVTGTIDVTGRLADPQVHGDLDLRDAGLRIDYLNTRYRFSHPVQVRPDMFALDFATVYDEEGNTAVMSATILHNGLKEWNYHLWGEMDRFLALNTTLRDNALYYGKAYGTGELSMSGYLGRMEVTVDARTAPGTDIHLPVGGSTEVSSIGFVRFTSKEGAEAEAPAVDLSGISLDMKVEVTPDALFELIFDPTVGDILAGRGRGTLQLGVTQSGDFSMRGQVEVIDGDYLFTLRNVVNKRFQIEPGGVITWYGDPFDAQLDLKALYRLRAPLYDIMFEKNEAYRRRVPVDVVMHLRDKLLNPEIVFAVRLPTVDEAVRMQVNSVLSTEQEMNRQVFALIVLNRFLQPPTWGGGASGPGGANFAGTTGSELLSNQVSNWLSKLSSEFDLGVNYRPGDNLTQDELELAVSTQLFDERLLVSTNLGVQYGAAAARNSNALVGDFQLEYLLPPEGKIRLKAFSVSNDRNLNRTDQSLTTQGAGVAYREEFNTWKEFWKGVGGLFSRKKK
ncbi:MAG: translocation/assembly module TamB [Flavobacteriales bacterium]|nr:translocation/assembly module TamB [Flavobacteriales bacterium]